MNDLQGIYRQLTGTRSPERLADCYRAAEQQAASMVAGRGAEPARPIPVVAAAVPPLATVNTAVYTLHALPKDAGGGLAEQLLEIAHRNIVHALHRCRRALELDGTSHGYTVEEWLPTVYEIAGSLLRSARLDTEPPTVVQATQEAISELSRAIAELDNGAENAPTSLSETLARLLVIWTFTDAALRAQESA
jgi:hypothetical protein